MASIAGTYFTTWESSSKSFQLGPIVVIGTDRSVVVDGVTMNQAMVAGTMVSWSSAAGNPSSGMLQFLFDSSLDAMTCSGTYWMSGGNHPSAANFYGFNTRPQASLDTWAGTYSCAETVDGSEEALGNLVISGTTVTFAGRTISNPIYTGLSANGTDTSELAWFTTDGNENNAAVSFFSQGNGRNFHGNIWAAGANRPAGSASAVNNFFGTTRSDSDTDAVGAEANLAHAAEMAAIGIALQVMAGAAGMAMMNMNAGDTPAAIAQHAQMAAQNVEQNAAPAEAQALDGAGDVGDTGDALEDLEDIAEENAEDFVEAAAGGVAHTPGTTPPHARGGSSKKASGLSAKELLQLKSAKRRS
jgi:hypothetical protein